MNQAVTSPPDLRGDFAAVRALAAPEMSAVDALRAVGTFRLAMPRTILRFAGGREITLGDLAERGVRGGVNAVIVGNYLTTLGRPADEDLAMLADLRMPIKALARNL